MPVRRQRVRCYVEMFISGVSPNTLFVLPSFSIISSTLGITHNKAVHNIRGESRIMVGGSISQNVGQIACSGLKGDYKWQMPIFPNYLYYQMAN